MAQVRLGKGIFIKLDGECFEDFETYPAGAIDTINNRTGTGDCSVGDGTFVPR